MKFGKKTQIALNPEGIELYKGTFNSTPSELGTLPQYFPRISFGVIQVKSFQDERAKLLQHFNIIHLFVSINEKETTKAKTAAIADT